MKVGPPAPLDIWWWGTRTIWIFPLYAFNSLKGVGMDEITAIITLSSLELKFYNNETRWACGIISIISIRAQPIEFANLYFFHFFHFSLHSYSSALWFTKCPFLRTISGYHHWFWKKICLSENTNGILSYEQQIK